MSDTLAVVENDGLALTSKRAMVLREALTEDAEQRALLRVYISKHMVEGTDYGKIPGTDKPTLLKPGAEKLVDLFRCTPKFVLVKQEEDFERGFFNYMFRVRLVSRDAKAVLAEGFGSANSREGRYRWRTASLKCPACQKETIIKGKAEFGGGWLCFGKKGGCGAKFKDGDQVIDKQPRGQVENDDIATLANTILKMAKKRALVDGAIALARCSDMFTQDVEDLAEAAAYVEATEPHSSTAKEQPKPVETGKRTTAIKAQLAARRVTIVDVEAGQTEQQAEAKVVRPAPSALPADQYGTGKAIKDLTNDELAHRLSFMRRHAADPKKKTKEGTAKIVELEAEEMRRIKVLAEEPPLPGDEEAPF